MAVNLRGDQGSFTFASGNTTITDGTTVDIDQWEGKFERQVNSVRPFGWAMEKVTLGPVRGRGRLRFTAITGTTPPLPGASIATTGTLKLGVTGPPGSPTKYYQGKAQVYSVQLAPDSSAATNITGYYEFVFSGDSSSDDFSVT